MWAVTIKNSSLAFIKQTMRCASRTRRYQSTPNCVIHLFSFDLSQHCECLEVKRRFHHPVKVARVLWDAQEEKENSQWTEFRSQIKQSTSYLPSGSIRLLQKWRVVGFNRCLKSARRDNAKIAPELTIETSSRLVLGLSLWLRSKYTVKETRTQFTAPSDLSRCWKQNRAPTRVQFPRVNKHMC